jgi:hypothetical protein
MTTERHRNAQRKDDYGWSEGDTRRLWARMESSFKPLRQRGTGRLDDLIREGGQNREVRIALRRALMCSVRLCLEQEERPERMHS